LGKHVVIGGRRIHLEIPTVTGQHLQYVRDRTVPLREGTPGDLYSMALENLLLSVQREVIAVFRGDHVGQ